MGVLVFYGGGSVLHYGSHNPSQEGRQCPVKPEDVK